MSIERMNSVTLQTPITLGDQEITTVNLRKPDTGGLRGIALSDILTLDVNAMMKLLPRITSPALSPSDIAALDPADFTDMALKVTTFFVSRKQMEGQPLFLEQEPGKS